MSLLPMAEMSPTWVASYSWVVWSDLGSPLHVDYTRLSRDTRSLYPGSVASVMSGTSEYLGVGYESVTRKF